MANGAIDSVSYQKDDLKSQHLGNATKKSRDIDRRRRRRKQKKNKASKNGDDSDTAAEDVKRTVDDSFKENFDPLKVVTLVSWIFSNVIFRVLNW